jgi:hypothetical protein
VKKLIIFSIFLIGLLPVVTAHEYLIIKIGKQMTVYTAEDYGNNNYWGENVTITKEESVLPDDSYFKDLNIPEEEWKIFSINQNGIYDSRLEKVVKEKKDLLNGNGLKKVTEEKEKIQKDYDKIFKEKANLIKWINSLEISKEKWRKNYNKILEEKSKMTTLINVLEISVVILLLIIIFLILKMTRTDFQKKLESARM